MKAFLMYRDRDSGVDLQLAPNEAELTKDLELKTLFTAMAGEDPFLYDVAREAVLAALANDLPTIRYRQGILEDCLKNQSVVRQLYALAGHAIERERKEVWGSFLNDPSVRLNRAREALQIFMEELTRLRALADEHADKFTSEGFSRLFAMLQAELSDQYLSEVQAHLKELKFRSGVLISAGLGKGNKGTNYVLRKPVVKEGWFTRVFLHRQLAYILYIHPRDESGARCLSELRDRGLVQVADALSRSMEHVRSFFQKLRYELAFYIGCMNAHEHLARKGEPVCFPRPAPPGQRRLAFEGLYDVCLALSVDQRVVGNDVRADGKQLLIITGANQGGKSTFLRSVGLALLMMQSGMYVSAVSFAADLCNGLFTHYKREEDASMERGKLDEELSRMSHVVDQLTDHAVILFNESFAATNEREGSEICSHIVRALLESKTKVVFVTHLYEFAHRFHQQAMRQVMFLRAERRPDGQRTFKLLEGEPLETSFGRDLYRSLFDDESDGEDARAYEERIVA
jgi:DNA mismatch repair ATPase MutS